jgi:hypothetical protein
MSILRIFVGFIIAYLLMFIAAAVPYAGPMIVGILGALIARCSRMCGSILGFSAVVLYVVTITAIDLMNPLELDIPDLILLRIFSALINGFFAALGGYFAGRIFERSKWY